MISWFVNFLMNPNHICFVMLQACTQTVSGHTFHIFDPVTVQVSLDSSNIQHQKLKIQLVEPKVFFYSHSCNSNCGCLCIMAVLLSHHLLPFHIILCYCAVAFKSIVLIILYSMDPLDQLRVLDIPIDISIDKHTDIPYHFMMCVAFWVIAISCKLMEMYIPQRNSRLARSRH